MMIRARSAVASSGWLYESVSGFFSAGVRGGGKEEKSIEMIRGKICVHSGVRLDRLRLNLDLLQRHIAGIKESQCLFPRQIGFHRIAFCFPNCCSRDCTSIH